VKSRRIISVSFSAANNRGLWGIGSKTCGNGVLDHPLQRRQDDEHQTHDGGKADHKIWLDRHQAQEFFHEGTPYTQHVRLI
jgi:hypothetical protein